MTRKVTYTKHAIEMLSLRRIKKQSVEKCLKEPDKILPSRKRRKIYFKNFGKNDLKVVGAENEEFVVITCHWIASSRVK